MMRSILRKTSLALVGAGAAGVMVLALSGTSFAAVNTTNQAGYQAGNNSYRFRFVQGAMTLPLNGCANGNFINSGVQLIGASNAAVGARCNGASSFIVGWNVGYPGSGTTFPPVTFSATTAPGHRILLQIFYDQTTNFVHFTAVDETGGVTLFTVSSNAGAALYKEAVLSTDVSNPLVTPPAPGTNYTLVAWDSGALTTYNGTRGTGICGPWGTAEQQAVSGAKIVAAAPVLYNNCSQFNVRIYGTG
jgi:hypothetical protein